ncbi:MAG TPA: hypothetical protein VFF46_12620, partial [Kribbella sp.]
VRFQVPNTDALDITATPHSPKLAEPYRRLQGPLVCAMQTEPQSSTPTSTKSSPTIGPPNGLRSPVTPPTP